jgi:hypothetical protein
LFLKESSVIKSVAWQEAHLVLNNTSCLVSSEGTACFIAPVMVNFELEEVA